MYKSPTPTITISESFFTFFSINIRLLLSDEANKIEPLNIERAYQLSYIRNFEPDIGNSFREILFESRKFTKNV